MSPTNNKRLSIDAAAIGESLRRIPAQLRTLNPKEPGQWPVMVKVLAWVLAAVAVVILGWPVLLKGAYDDLNAAAEQEPKLKEEYTAKLGQAINLDALRQQKTQVEEYVNQLEKQLPGKAEMDALLSDINQAGIGRGLQFELFKPNQVIVKDYYAELPISIKVSGRYHEIGNFAADISNLSRIVTLHDLGIQPTTKDASGNLTMEATARTYRYLDPNEVAEVRRTAEAAKKANK